MSRAALLATALTVLVSANALAQPPTPPPFHLDAEPSFDIGLAVRQDSLRIEAQGALTLFWRAPGGDDRSVSLHEPVRIRLSGAQALVEPLGAPRAVPLAVLEARDTLWVGDSSLVRGNDASLLWGGRHWRGRFKVFLGPGGTLSLATRVGLEHYLVGVVPGEIGALRDSLLEAGRAQAVAARSYSLFYRGRRGSEGFDLYGTTEDQVYGPLESERPLATRCVESTHGLTALSEHAPIRANYCSTCGGMSAEAWEAWPTEARTYLRAAADRTGSEPDHCALSPQYRWREEWPVAEFLADVATYAPAQQVPLPRAALGELRDVRVDARSRSGRVWRLTVVTTSGEVTIPAYSLRQVLRRPGNPAAILRSNLFKIGVRHDAQGRAVAVVASGAGSGHGVGLCQTGALAMARGGTSAESILEHYYPGVSLERLY